MAVMEAVRAQTEMRRARMLIGGEWVMAAAGEVLPVETPARRETIAETRAAAPPM